MTSWPITAGLSAPVITSYSIHYTKLYELRPRANATLKLIAQIGILVMALVFVWYGIKFLQFGWDQTSELADLPVITSYSIHYTKLYDAVPERAEVHAPRGVGIEQAVANGKRPAVGQVRKVDREV